jgi:serine/threonine-protein kinase
MAVGSVNYAPPEQLMGESLDGRADQYGLAATAYQLLTGRTLFEHSNPAVVISKHLSASPPRLEDVNSELAPLDPVLSRGLAKAPDDRYTTCLDFAAALRASMGHHRAITETRSASSDPTLAAIAEPTSANADLTVRNLPPPVVVAPTNAAPGATTRQAPVQLTADFTGATSGNLAPAEIAASEASGRGRRSTAILVPAVLALVLIAAITFASVEFTRSRSFADSSTPPWQPYVDAGKANAQFLTSIDYRSVDADVQRVLDNSTGAFWNDFKSRADAFSQSVRDAQSVSEGNVSGAGLESWSGSDAKVVVAIAVTTTVNNVKEEPKAWRMRIEIKKSGDAYKASSVEFVP